MYPYNIITMTALFVIHINVRFQFIKHFVKNKCHDFFLLEAFDITVPYIKIRVHRINIQYSV